MEVLAAPSGVINAVAAQPEAVAPAAAPIAAPANDGKASPAVASVPQQSGLAPAIAKLFGSGAPQPITLNVSYRVTDNPNQIVTVFTDPQTGKEVAQFPPELLIGIAQFFDQQQGATIDQNA